MEQSKIFRIKSTNFLIILGDLIGATEFYNQFYLGNINKIDFWLIYIPYMLQLIKRKQEETMMK